MERGGFGNVARAEVCESHRVCWSGRARCWVRDRSLGGRCRGCGWCGRVGGGRPARVGVLVLDGDGRTFRRVVAQEEAVDAAAARRQERANQWVSSRRGRAARAAARRCGRAGVFRRVRSPGWRACWSRRHACGVPGRARCAHSAACAVQCSARVCLSLGECWAQGRHWARATRGPGSRASEHGATGLGAESCAIWVSANAEKSFFLRAAPAQAHFQAIEGGPAYLPK